MMGTEIFKIDSSWAEKLTKTRVSFLMTPTVLRHYYAKWALTKDNRIGHEYLTLTFAFNYV